MAKAQAPQLSTRCSGLCGAGGAEFVQLAGLGKVARPHRASASPFDDQGAAASISVIGTNRTVHRPRRLRAGHESRSSCKSWPLASRALPDGVGSGHQETALEGRRRVSPRSGRTVEGAMCVSPSMCAHMRVHVCVRVCVRLEGAAGSQQPKVQRVVREARLHPASEDSSRQQRRHSLAQRAPARPGPGCRSSSPRPHGKFRAGADMGLSREGGSASPPSLASRSCRPGAVVPGLCVQTAVCDYAKQRR